MDTSLVYQIYHLLTRNKISIDKEELDFQIKSHPTYPSLHAITGVLDHFNINNLALDVPVDQDTLQQLPESFLARVRTPEGEDFAVVTKKNEDYELVFSKKKKSAFTLTSFLESFTGIIVAVEKTEETDTIKSTSRNYGTLLTSISLVLVFILFLTTQPTLSASLYFGLSLIGLLLSSSILKQELGFQNILGDAICSDRDEKKDCNAVLSSNGAKLFGPFKLSDLSIIYFVVLSLLSLLFVWRQTPLTLLYTISLLALPITIYSIYYQYKVVKKWCLLCLSIVAVLWLQAAIILLPNTTFAIYDTQLDQILFGATIFTILVTAWYFVSPIIRGQQESKQLKIDYYKFKKNFSLFQTSLQQKDSLNTAIAGIDEIQFGAKNPVSNITFITNPLCGHCKEVHHLLEDILKKNTQNTLLTVRFYTNPEHSEDPSVRITARLLELFHTDSPTTCLKAMHDIYGDYTQDNWFAKWGECQNNEAYFKILEQQSQWCKDNNINFTPEILVNGYSYPSAYKRNDLIYFIEELEEGQ